jgi:hypothetical protein
VKKQPRRKWFFLILFMLIVVIVGSVVWYYTTQNQSVEREKEWLVEAEIIDDYYDSDRDVAVFLLNLSSSYENVNFTAFKVKGSDKEITVNELVLDTGLVYGLEIERYKSYAEEYGYYEITFQLFFHDANTGEFLEGGEVVVTPPEVDGFDEL